jgi:hypothetical protein
MLKKNLGFGNGSFFRNCVGFQTRVLTPKGRPPNHQIMRQAVSTASGRLCVIFGKISSDFFCEIANCRATFVHLLIFICNSGFVRLVS